MKVTYFLGCFLGCAAVLLLGASAAEYKDDMNSASDTEFKSYYNLTPQSYRVASSLPDATALGFANPSQSMGSAVYLASGVETVRAAIYTHAGTTVAQDPASGQYMLGVFSQNPAEAIAGATVQALYCPQTGGVYTEAGGLKQAATDMASYLFVPVITQPQGEKIGYGVNIYYSVNGGQFTRVPVTGLSVKYDLTNQVCYEEYSATVPQSATRIKVEINDAYKVPLISGGSMEKGQRQMTAVASVTLSGSRMSLGIPAQSSSIGTESSGGEYYDGAAAAEQYAAQKSVGSDEEGGDEADAVYLDGEKEETSSKAEQSSKFSGTITSSSKEQRSSSSRKPSSKSVEASGSSSGSSNLSSEGSEARGESIVYEILRGQQDSRFNGAVIAYIIVIIGAILLVAVLPKKK